MRDGIALVKIQIAMLSSAGHCPLPTGCQLGTDDSGLGRSSGFLRHQPTAAVVDLLLRLRLSSPESQTASWYCAWPSHAEPFSVPIRPPRPAVSQSKSTLVLGPCIREATREGNESAEPMRLAVTDFSFPSDHPYVRTPAHSGNGAREGVTET